MKIIKRKNDSLSPVYTPMRSILDDFFATPALLDSFLGGPFTSKDISVDVWEEGDTFHIKMALPGVDKDDVQIEVTDESITVKGHTKKEEKSDKDKKYYYKTLETSFEQTFNLPGKVDADKAEASYKDGILTLSLPKSEDTKPKKIEVK